MSGNTAGNAPDDGDDPFAYLYRPEGGQSGPVPRQPSYHQVRPVGERTYGGGYGGGHGGGSAGPRGQQGYRRPDARYTAPENQPGAGPYGGGPDRGDPGGPEPRRNGLLIGAIAVVAAVVLGVGAALLSSGGGADPADDGGTASTSQYGENGSRSDQQQDETPADDEEQPNGLPAADLSQLQLAGGAVLDSSVEGARSDGGEYVTGLSPQGQITWTFDFEGDPGQYRMYVGYSVEHGNHKLGFLVNGQPRDDRVELKDYGKSGAFATNWTETWNLIDVREGSNTVQFTCDGSCDALIDQIRLADNAD